MNGVVVAAWVALTAAGAAVATDCVTTENAGITYFTLEQGYSVAYQNGDRDDVLRNRLMRSCQDITYCTDFCTTNNCNAYIFAPAPTAGDLCECLIFMGLSSSAPFSYEIPNNFGTITIDCRSGVTPLVVNRGACTVTAHQYYYDEYTGEGVLIPARYTNGWNVFQTLTENETWTNTVDKCAEKCIQTPDCSAFAFDTNEDNSEPAFCDLIRRSASAVLVPTVYISDDQALFARRSTGDCGPLPTPKPSPPPPAVPPAPPPEAKKKSPWNWLAPILAVVGIIIVIIVYRKCEKNNKNLASMTDSML